MSYLVDSDVTMDYLNAQPHALALFQVLLAKDVAISTIAIGEIYQGIYDGYDPVGDAKAFERLLAEFAELPFDIDIARTYGRIRGAARKLVPRPGDPDIMIAATAIHHDLILVTRNTKDFVQISDLKLYDWNTAPQ